MLPRRCSLFWTKSATCFIPHRGRRYLISHGQRRCAILISFFRRGRRPRRPVYRHFAKCRQSFFAATRGGGAQISFFRRGRRPRRPAYRHFVKCEFKLFLPLRAAAAHKFHIPCRGRRPRRPVSQASSRFEKRKNKHFMPLRGAAHKDGSCRALKGPVQSHSRLSCYRVDAPCFGQNQPPASSRTAGAGI